jgi:hypothetical protein
MHSRTMLVKCKRDVGILVDAVTNDLKHGGNAQSRLAALSYFTPAGASYITGQTAETAAAINRAIIHCSASGWKFFKLQCRTRHN